MERTSIRFNSPYAKYFLLVILLAVAGYSLSRFASPSEVRAALSKTNIVLFSVAVLTYFASVPIRTYRWQLLLQKLDVRLPVVTGNVLLLLSLYFNTLLPAKVGDLYKCQLVGRQWDVSRATVIGTAAVERTVDIMILGVGVLFSVTVVVSQITESVAQVLVLALMATGVLGVGVVIIAFVPVSVLPSPIHNQIKQFRFGLSTATSKNVFVEVVALSGVVWVLNVIRIGLLVRALNVQLGIYEIILVAFLVAFLTGLPYTPAGIGVVEFVGTVVLVTLGVPGVASVSIVLLDRLITVGIVVVTGTFLYLVLHVTRPELLTGDPFA